MSTRGRLHQAQGDQRDHQIKSIPAKVEGPSLQVDTSTTTAVRRARTNPDALSRGDVLHLQGIIGNRAVQHVMRHEIDIGQELQAAGQDVSDVQPDHLEDSGGE